MSIENEGIEAELEAVRAKYDEAASKLRALNAEHEVLQNALQFANSACREINNALGCRPGHALAAIAELQTRANNADSQSARACISELEYTESRLNAIRRERDELKARVEYLEANPVHSIALDWSGRDEAKARIAELEAQLAEHAAPEDADDDPREVRVGDVRVFDGEYVTVRLIEGGECVYKSQRSGICVGTVACFVNCRLIARAESAT